MNKNEQYDILVFARDTAQLIGESTRLVWVQLKEWDLKKSLLTKVMGDS